MKTLKHLYFPMRHPTKKHLLFFAGMLCCLFSISLIRADAQTIPLAQYPFSSVTSPKPYARFALPNFRIAGSSYTDYRFEFGTETAVGRPGPYVIDINDDGVDDLLYSGPDSADRYRERQYVALGKSQGGYEVVYACSRPTNVPNPTVNCGAARTENSLRPFEDFVSPNLMRVTSERPGNGTLRDTPAAWALPKMSISTGTPIFTDINGDGLPDMIYSTGDESTGTYWYQFVAINTGEDFVVAYSCNNVSGYRGHCSGTSTGPLSGNSGTFRPLAPWALSPSSAVKKTTPLPYALPEAVIGISAGTVTPPASTQQQPYTLYSPLFSDVNGDGLPDITYSAPKSTAGRMGSVTNGSSGSQVSSWLPGYVEWKQLVAMNTGSGFKPVYRCIKKFNQYVSFAPTFTFQGDCAGP
ncbi:MAG: hypothetical protein Q8P95_00090 [bacterium]|nr:hypothetical protein [bacterium]